MMPVASIILPTVSFDSVTQTGGENNAEAEILNVNTSSNKVMILFIFYVFKKFSQIYKNKNHS